LLERSYSRMLLRKLRTTSARWASRILWATTRLRSMRQTASQTTLGTLETLRLVRGQLSHTS